MDFHRELEILLKLELKLSTDEANAKTIKIIMKVGEENVT